MQSQFYLRAAICTALLMAGACSTVRNDGTTVSSTIEMMIHTIPEGGRCVLERRGEQIAVVEKTPQSVSFDRSAREITVTCAMDRHITTVETMQTRFVGGPLRPTPSPLVGLVAAAIVYGSPANYEYPSSYQKRLPSNVFENAAERDAMYEELRGIIVERHENRINKIKNECSNAETCRVEQQAADKQRDSELAQLETFKAKAEIAPPAPKPVDKPAARKPG
jgi:hypothetical protein